MNLLAREVFANPSYVKAVFRADRFGTALHLDLGMRAVKTLDLLALTVPTSSDPIAFFCRQEGTIGLRLSTLRHVFADQRHGEQHINRIASRAWVAYHVYVKFGAHVVGQSSVLDTTHFTLAALDCLSNLVRDADSLDALKPMITKNDVATDFSFKDGQLQVQSSRYKTRVQASSAQTVRVEGKDNDKNTRVVCEGRTVDVQGRAATINLETPLSGTEVSVWTVGKDPLTRAQAKRQRIIWGAFHMNNGFLSNFFVAAIWLSKALPVGLRPSALPPPPSIRFSKDINPSQEAAIERILSDADEDAMAVIHGPPGTGKTTVIAAATNSISAAYPERSVWLIAQSNVAVKNIAEKLASVGFYKFRLLVSEGFHFDWYVDVFEADP
ncbi:hypothetical protein EWM64_g4914 [Hericium alpestre]|uniref:DNA2/NAM7 helicase helicase domain-containing protein n=1 Tax=Hericium alpestre TaxID=135208 RepID=A0A4Y9ZYS1_9AGAM|nr:hypothetical protein EWM64_g4914 [Hericium alpestre]